MYDDGGLSGGTIERPALQRLLSAIKAGKVQIIVVYKVDRLTRSLADFAKIVDVLDAHNASFVSVTQQFNTTTSLGRLTLNMLLSFAQFEREIADERIRDKIAASKGLGAYGAGVRLLALTGAGRSEVFGMAWQEIDMPAKTWTLPAARAKNGRQHSVPLSDAVLAILGSLPRGDAIFGVFEPVSFSRMKRRARQAIAARFPRMVSSRFAKIGRERHGEPWHRAACDRGGSQSSLGRHPWRGGGLQQIQLCGREKERARRMGGACYLPRSLAGIDPRARRSNGPRPTC